MRVEVESPPDSGTGIYKGPVVRRKLREEDQKKVRRWRRGWSSENLGEYGMPDVTGGQSFHSSVCIFFRRAIKPLESFKHKSSMISIY